jgi:thiamine-monophosphate kinase
MTQLGPGREFDLIRELVRRWGPRARDIGGDCAIVEAGGERLAVSIDVSVEDVHFRRAWLTPREIGYRAAAAALSDLAACAAEPAALLLTIAVPEQDAAELALAIGEGAGDAVADAGAVIVGGDMSRSERIVVDCCVIGRTAPGIGRAGAKPGDQLVVTGALGGPLAALEAWNAGREPAPEARARFARPAPRHAAARYLAHLRARAMIDISDGLAGDLQHLLAAGQLGATLDADRIPLLPSARAAATAAGEPAWSFASRSGEEYELLAALPPDVTADELAHAPVPVTIIGAFDAEPGMRARAGGQDVTLPGTHDHFARGR